MSNLTQEQIDNIIQFIDTAEDPGVITNAIVAAVLAYLAGKVKSMAIANDLNVEASARAAADAALQNSIQSEATARAAADTTMSARIAEIETALLDLTENITPETLEALAEAIAFLDGIGDDDSLATLLAGLNSRLGDVETGLAGKADVTRQTGRLAYSQMPHLVLASMGSDLDGKTISLGELTDCYVYVKSERKIFYNNSNADPVAGITPDKGFVYCNAVTGKQYNWTGEQENPWQEISFSPRTIVATVSSTYTPNPPAGLDDYWYIVNHPTIGVKLIHLHRVVTGSDSRIDEERLDLDSRVLYYSVNDAAWYHYNGTSLVKVNTYIKPDTGIPASDIAGDVIKSITVNGGTAQTPQNGNVNIEVSGEKGDKGDKGDTGLTGPQGAQGNSGVASADGIESVNNLDGAPEDTESKAYVLGANMGKQLNDKVEDLEPHTTSSEADFDIRDENGNVLLEVAGGHIKTKNFDSSDIHIDDEEVEGGELTTGETAADMDIRDEDGNVLLSCSEGHVKTSEFDSKNVYNKQEVDSLVDGGLSKPHLHILILGNSYSADSWSYVPFILKEYGIEITLGIYLKSAGSLYYIDTNYSTAQENFNGSLYVIDTSEETSWNQTPVIAMASPHSSVMYPHDNALGWNWGMIIMQEASTESVTEGGIGYNATTKVYNHAGGAINKVRQDMAGISAPFLLGWNINHTRLTENGTYDKPQTVIDCVKATCEEYQIDFIFPYGTAIFDARRNAGLDALGTTGHMLQDNVHLQEGLPCYIAALANVECLFRNFFPAYSVIGDATVPDSSWISGKVIGRNGDPVGVTASNLKLARQIAVIANKNPFLIKNYI